MSAKKLLEKLTDVFTKDENSNFGKLFLILDENLMEIKNLLIKTEKWRDINNAEGRALNELGENVGQNRGRATDEIYRVLIRGKVARNASDGSINKMVHAIASSLNCNYSDIHIMNANDSSSSDEKEPAAIIIQKIPLDALNNVGISTNQFLQIIDSIVAGGVRVAYVSLEGTFSFSNSSSIETSEQGFADINMASGGTLGGVFTPSNDYELPL